MTKLWYAGAAVASGFLLFAAAAPAQAAVPLDGRRPLTQMRPALLPAPPTEGLPSADVLGGGRQQSFDSLARPTVGVPLLGGARPVSGLPATPGGDQPQAPGSPGGGMAVLAPAVANATDPAATHPAAGPTTPADAVAAGPAVVAPARHKHKVKPAARAVQPPADPRLHEEPIDGEATFSHS